MTNQIITGGESLHRLFTPSLTGTTWRRYFFDRSITEPGRVAQDMISDARFENCVFSGGTLKRLIFKDCQFLNCTFVGTKFRDVQFLGCQISGCTLEERVEFKDVSFRETVIKMTPFSKAVLENIIFRLCSLRYLNMMGCEWRGWIKIERSTLEYINFGPGKLANLFISYSLTSFSDFLHTRFSHGAFKFTQFTNCSFFAADFDHMDVTESKIYIDDGHITTFEGATTLGELFDVLEKETI